MEWGAKENRIAVIALHKCGKSASEIYEFLKKLNISRMFLYRTINRTSQTSQVQDRKRSGRPRLIQTSAAIKAVREKIRRKPLRKQKIMSKEMNVSTRTMSRLIRDDLHMKTRLKKIRLDASSFFGATRLTTMKIFLSQMRKFSLFKKFLISKTTKSMLKLLKTQKIKKCSKGSAWPPSSLRDGLVASVL